MTTYTLKKITEQIEKNKKIISDLQNQIRSLEQKQTEKLVHVTRNNADEKAQHALQFIEKDLEINKDIYHTLERQLAEITQQFKEIMNHFDNQVTDHIQEKLAKAREDRDRLRSEVLPVMQRLLSDMEDRKRELDSLVLSLSNQLSKINRQQYSGEGESNNFNDEL